MRMNTAGGQWWGWKQLEDNNEDGDSWRTMMRMNIAKGQGWGWIQQEDKDEDRYCGSPYLISNVFSLVTINLNFYILFFFKEKNIVWKHFQN